MKMAEKSSIVIFPSNCDNIMDSVDEKNPNNDISTEINKPGDEPIVIENATPEDAIEDEFLAGEHKDDFQDDLLLHNLGAGSDGIEFKQESVLELGEEEEDEDEEDEMEDLHEVEEEGAHSEVLTKMQIMEDVREACSVQPSSPGHADERHDVENGPQANGLGPVDTEPTNTDDKPNIKSEIQEEKSDVITNGDCGENSQDVAGHGNDESSSSTSCEEVSHKRKSDEIEGINKRLRFDIQDSFLTRDKILNEFIELADCGSLEQMQAQTEQILAEIRTLNEMAKEKEREWNNIIHLKKMKEELLLRMQRRKQVMLLNEKNENGEFSESQLSSNQSILKTNQSSQKKGISIMEKSKHHRNILPKLPLFSQETNGSTDLRQMKQRPVLDVQSIIADYRQRHPEIVPRRGRRIRSAHNDKHTNHILNFSSLALGSGSQVHQNVDINSDLGILLNAMDSNRADPSRESSLTNELSFKDMLVQFAKLSQNERELLQNAIKPPPPYPEVTVHPVPTTAAAAPNNSLLHGILTKAPSKTNTKSSFSPTLARLLTAPERSSTLSPTTPIGNNLTTSPNMSISEILSTSKARNEITITPVDSQYELPSNKVKQTNQDEEEAEDSADRLVIDESNEMNEARTRGDNSSDAGDEVPQCQGCNQKSALFVCAGCGNQWYCSRECQVAAWDEHSEVCSG